MCLFALHLQCRSPPDSSTSKRLVVQLDDAPETWGLGPLTMDGVEIHAASVRTIPARTALSTRLLEAFHGFLVLCWLFLSEVDHGYGLMLNMDIRGSPKTATITVAITTAHALTLLQGLQLRRCCSRIVSCSISCQAARTHEHDTHSIEP